MDQAEGLGEDARATVRGYGGWRGRVVWGRCALAMRLRDLHQIVPIPNLFSAI
ncbi:MAG: hypothetical protein AAFV78_13895 [Bacteroidota bacterium]